MTPRERKILRIALWTLATPLILVVLLALLLYIPVVQDWVCQGVVSVLNSTSDDVEYEVGKVRLTWPLHIEVSDVTMKHRPDGKLMLSIGKVKTGLDDFPFSQDRYIVNALHIADVRVAMDSLTEGVGLDGTLRQLDVKRIELDLEHNDVRVREVLAREPHLHIDLRESVPDTTETSEDWTVALGRIGLVKGSLALDLNHDTIAPQLDVNHLRLADLMLEAEEISYSPSQVKARVNLLQGREENSGLEVQQLALDFGMNGDRIAVDDLDLQLAPEDYLRGNALLDLTLTDEHPQGVADVALSVAIDSTNLMRLVKPFVPQLAQQWSIGGQNRLELDARLTPDTLNLRNAHLDIPGHAELTAQGIGTQWLDSLQRQIDLTAHGALLHVEPLLATFVSPASERDYRVPDSLRLALDATQNGPNLYTRAEVSQMGHPVLEAEATYNTETEAYQLSAMTHALDVSSYMPALGLDALSMHVEAEGRHFDPTVRHTRLEASLVLDSLFLLADGGRLDSLKGVTLEASLHDGNYRAKITSAHPTLRMDASVEGRYLRDTVSAQGYIDVRRADLADLPYVSLDPNLGRLSFNSHFEAGYNWADNARLRLSFDTLVYNEGELHQHFDHIVLAMDSHKDWLMADVTGGDALLGINVNQSIAQLPVMADSLLTVLNSQISSLRPDFAALCDKLPKLDVQLRMARENPFSQAIERRMGISFDRAWLTLINDRQLTLSGQVHNYLDGMGGMSFDTIAIDMQPADIARAYDYRLHAQHHDIRDTKAYNIHAAGRLMPDSLTAGVTYVNGHQKTVYDVLASLALGNDTMTLHLEEGPTLYEQPFTVNKDNYIRLMKYLDLEHFKPETRARVMLDGPRDLKLNLYTRKIPDLEVGNQMLLRVQNLDLDYVHRLMEWEGDASGHLNLTTSVNIFPDSLHARLRAGIKGLGLGSYSADTVALDMTALMAHNLRDLTGTVSIDSIPKLSLDANLADSTDIRATIADLPLPLLNAFLPSNMLMRGTASGQFSMLGKDMDHATLSGGLAMHEAGMTYTDLNAQLSFPTDTIRFARNRLLIRDYKIMAANQNPVNVRGLIDFSKDVSDPAISLTITGENVRLINNRKLELKDQYICGRLPMSPNIKVRGSLSKLDVTGSLGILSGTDLMYYMQDDPLESSSEIDQMVEFVDFDKIDRMIGSNRGRRSQQQTSTQADELNVDLKIEIANGAKMKAYLAGTDNNSVDIVGGGGLNLQCTADGSMVMNGTFAINSGKVGYKLPILPMVKNFSIANGSNLIWPGSDPTNPEINITATEEVKSTVNDDAGSRVVKFLVSIHISGTLDALSLSFDCDAPEDGAISSDIATLDADERSKAALMLLIAQTYVGPGNSSSMGLGTANAALNSMLNREMESMLAGMKHTNIDLGIDTYNTEAGNTRTDYSVKVSQNFFNDRFRATIGGQVSSGGDARQSSGARLGDMSLEWLIRKDGSHLLKLYRTTNYESVLEGELIETGLSYVQERSGYRLKQLFVPTSKKRQQQIQQQVKEMQSKEEQAEREARRRRMQGPSAPPADSVKKPDIVSPTDTTNSNETKPE